MKPVRCVLLSAGLLGAALIGAGPALAQQDGFQQQVDPASVSKNPALAGVRVDEKPGAQVPLSPTFRDENGKTTPFGAVFHGRPVVILPIFYRCKGVCNLELQGVLNALIRSPRIMPGRDLDVVVLGINPTEGPPLALAKKRSVLDEYGKPQSAPGWHFLTGDLPDIRAVTDSMGFSYVYDAVKNVVNHPSGVMVLTPTGKVSSYILNPIIGPLALQQDLKAAAVQAIEPKSEDQFFGCFHVDPVTGRRSIVVTRVMQVFAVLTLCALLATMVGCSLRARRRGI